jgi:GntR family transcriptional repressor for pyruvate dehydrogenase complex
MTTRATPRSRAAGGTEPDALAGERVVLHIERLIESGQLKPGDRLPAERELARRIGVSRPTLRSGLQSLAALGVLESRHGAGTFITAGPPKLATGPLSLLASLHGFTRDEMFEVRSALEVSAAGLAAERATGHDLAAMAEEVTGMFAALQEPQAFLVHDVRFHRAVAAASKNAVLAALVEMISALVYERRRLTVELARDLKVSADMHRRIYRAIRERDGERARREMREHLDLARMAQASESAAPAAPAAASDAR